MLNQGIGWIGLIIMLVAYFLLSYGKINGRSKIYQILNLIGAVALGINAFGQKAWPVVALEFFWCCIAIATLLRKK